MAKPRQRSTSVQSVSTREIHSLQEAFEHLDVHALKFVFLTRSCLPRFIWLLLFLGGCAAAGYYIRQICIDFLGHQTATKIATKIQEEYDYPPIFLCPRYNWDLAKIARHNLSFDAVVHAASLGQKNDSLHPLPALKTETVFAEDRLHRFIQENPQIKKKTYGEFYTWVALDSSAIIQEYAGIQSTGFSSVFVTSPNHENKPVSCRACYNVSAGKYNPHTGDVFYLQYSIDQPPEGNLGFNNDFAFIKDDHRVVLEKDRIYLRTNRVTTIRLSVKEYSRRETKESKCKKLEEVEKSYSQQDCRYHCFQKAVERCSKCKVLCDDTGLVGYNMLCTWLTKSNLSINCDEYETKAYKKCLSTCEPLCEYKSYDFSVAVAVLNASSYTDPRIRLWIYFLVDDGIMVFEEIPIYNLQTLISNIGGQMGLWTGASILTVIELVYLLTQFFCADWEVRKEKRHRRRAESLNEAQDKENAEADEAEKGEHDPVMDGEDGDGEKDKLPVSEDGKENEKGGKNTKNSA